MRLFLLSSQAAAFLCPAVDSFTVSEGKLCKDSMQEMANSLNESLSF